MPKAIKGVYENGAIKLPLQELPETMEELQVTVIFWEVDTNTPNVKESMMAKIDVAAEKKSLKEDNTFSIVESNFFSLQPEHLGRTSASELDEIIAEEASGKEALYGNRTLGPMEGIFHITSGS